MKKLLYIFVFTLALVGTTTFAIAQKTTTTTTTTKPFVKFKPPVLKTSLGILSDTCTAPLSQASAVLEQKIKVTDAKGQVYVVQSYQMLYRKRTVTEDDMGNPRPSTGLVSQQFYGADALPDIWVKVLREDLKKDEELFFFDIFVKDSQGRIMKAKDLKISVI